MEVILEPRDLALMRDFLVAVEGTAARCFLVGAGARVLGFDRRWGLRGGRATLDWDFAIQVKGWDHWKTVRSRLVEGRTPRFRAGEGEHRFHHVEGAVLDLVPYGGVESPPGELVWPGSTRMSVLGFEDAGLARGFVDAGGGLVVPIATVPSLALLKLHAYKDRRQRGERRDIQDFDWFLTHYEAADNELRIHDELGELLRREVFDILDAGAALLGVDVARVHARESIAPTRDLLFEARDPWSRTVTDALAHETSIGDEDERRRAAVIGRFRAFESGLDHEAEHGVH